MSRGTIKVEITDSDMFKEFTYLYANLLNDSRIDENIRKEHNKKLDEFIEKYEFDTSRYKIEKK